MSARLAHWALSLAAAIGCASPPPAAPTGPAEPPAPAPWSPDEGRGVASNDGGYWVTWLMGPEGVPLNEDFDIEVRVFDQTRAHRADDVEVRVDARMPAHGHGMLQDPELVELPDGALAVRGLRLHMIGRWELYVDLRRGPLTERAQFEIVLE